MTCRSRIGLALIAVGAALVLTGAVGLAAAAPHHDCGEERAEIKLGLDPEARVIATAPFDTTIAALAGVRRPRTTPADQRASSVERTVYRVHAVLSGYKLEDDGDIHVVISDGMQTMIVEIPAPDCVGADRTAPEHGSGQPRAVSAWRDQIVAARAALLQLIADRRLPAPGPRLRHADIPVVVTGVGFFDFIHGQTGVAPNGIELHPVLAIAPGGQS